jgi:tetratricopeptide (TPR) repeat protein
MSNNIELISLKCASCGASLENFQGKTEAVCEFCNNTTQILRPIKVNTSVIKLAENDSARFNNFISIMEKSMVAGNYKEAYDYCNKALEVDPNTAALWENKAICSFWLRSDSEIIESEAKEILTYLNAAKQAEPDSPTYSNTARSIASNLYFAVYYRYWRMSCDWSSDGKNYDSYSAESTKKIVNFIKLMNLCFDIYAQKMYLETAVNELTGLAKMTWVGYDDNNNLANMNWCANYSVDPLKMRENYIAKIKKIDPSYIAPDFPPPSESTPTWVWYLVAGIILFVIIKALN